MSSSSTWIVSSAYGRNDRWLRENLWSELDSIHCRWMDPWCIGVIGISFVFPQKEWVVIGLLQICNLYWIGSTPSLSLICLWGVLDLGGRTIEIRQFCLALIDFWCSEIGLMYFLNRSQRPSTALLFLIQIVKGGVPPLFRFELMWLEEKQFVDLIREWWESFSVEG